MLTPASLHTKKRADEMRISTRGAKTLIPLLAIALASAMAPATGDSNNGGEKKGHVIYNSVISPLPGNLPSIGFEATAFNEFGNAVNFSPGATHDLTKVVVTLSSWGCASGSWSLTTCASPKEATFTEPITLNVYNPSTDGVNPGTKIASVTETFNILFRPSASPLCVGGNAGKWYQKSSKTCFNGLAQNITFTLNNVKVGTSAIFGITYNTTHYGYAPIGQSAACFTTSSGCGYDSLNVALTQDPNNVTVGNSVVPGKLWVASTNSGQYADNGVAGLGTFRIDSPGVTPWWGANAPYDSTPWYVPAIRVFANQVGKDENQADEKSSSTEAPESAGDSKHAIKKD